MPPVARVTCEGRDAAEPTVRADAVAGLAAGAAAGGAVPASEPLPNGSQPDAPAGAGPVMLRVADITFAHQGTGGGRNEVTGTVASVDAAAKTFVVTTGTGTVTVATDASTTFKKNGAAATFGDVAAGATVDVEGTTQSSSAFLAKEVEIET